MRSLVYKSCAEQDRISGPWYTESFKVNFLCWLLLRCPYHGTVTTTAVTAADVKGYDAPAQSAGGRLQHAPYVCGFACSDVTWCMVVWLHGVHRTRRQQFHLAPDM